MSSLPQDKSSCFNSPICEPFPEKKDSTYKKMTTFTSMFPYSNVDIKTFKQNPDTNRDPNPNDYSITPSFVETAADVKLFQQWFDFAPQHQFKILNLNSYEKDNKEGKWTPIFMNSTKIEVVLPKPMTSAFFQGLDGVFGLAIGLAPPNFFTFSQKLLDPYFSNYGSPNFKISPNEERYFAVDLNGLNDANANYSRNQEEFGFWKNPNPEREIFKSKSTNQSSILLGKQEISSYLKETYNYQGEIFSNSQENNRIFWTSRQLRLNSYIAKQIVKEPFYQFAGHQFYAYGATICNSNMFSNFSSYWPMEIDTKFAGIALPEPFWRSILASVGIEIYKYKEPYRYLLENEHTPQVGVDGTPAKYATLKLKDWDDEMIERLPVLKFWASEEDAKDKKEDRSLSIPLSIFFRKQKFVFFPLFCFFMFLKIL